MSPPLQMPRTANDDGDRRPNTEDDADGHESSEWPGYPKQSSDDWGYDNKTLDTTRQAAMRAQKERLTEVRSIGQRYIDIYETLLEMSGRWPAERRQVLTRLTHLRSQFQIPKKEMRTAELESASAELDFELWRTCMKDVPDSVQEIDFDAGYQQKDHIIPDFEELLTEIGSELIKVASAETDSEAQVVKNLLKLIEEHQLEATRMRKARKTPQMSSELATEERVLWEPLMTCITRLSNALTGQI